MTINKQVEDAIGDMKGVLYRVDERVKTLIDTQKYLSERFDKFMLVHNDLVERVARLETVLNGSGKNFEEVEIQYHALKDRIRTIELSRDSITECEVILDKLNIRVTELESMTKMHNFKLDTWTRRAAWFGDLIFKCSWVLGMGYLLYKLGLGGVNFAPN